MNAPTVDPRLLAPLIAALAKQRELASNSAAELEARNAVLSADNDALRKQIQELTPKAG